MKKEATILGIILVLIFFANALLSDLTHGSNEILIKTNGNSMTFKEAMENNYLADEYPRATNPLTNFITKGHNAEDIIVEVQGEIKTLQEAIDSGEPNSNSNKGLCSSISHSYNENSLPEGYTYGHLATSIYISEDKTLQQTIDEGDYCDHFTYQFKAGTWGQCSNTCGQGINERDVWCERSNGEIVNDSHCLCTSENRILNNSYCASESDKPSTTQICDEGSTTCGWSAWSQTGVCSTSCGSGSYKRVRTCLVDGHCDGASEDYAGSSCTVYSGCSNQYITLHSRTTDFASQCSNYYWKHYWWEPASNDYVNPCTLKIGSGWSIYSISPRYNSGNQYWCDVTCIKQVPGDYYASGGTSYNSGGTYFSYPYNYDQCLDYGWKWLGGCPGGYKHYEYQLVSDSNGWGCRENCVKSTYA